MQNKLVPLQSLLLLIALTTSAQAYLDPGTGSILLQVILGGAAVALATGSAYLQRIKAFFLARKKSDNNDAGTPQDG